MCHLETDREQMKSIVFENGDKAGLNFFCPFSGLKSTSLCVSVLAVNEVFHPRHLMGFSDLLAAYSSSSRENWDTVSYQSQCQTWFLDRRGHRSEVGPSLFCVVTDYGYSRNRFSLLKWTICI